MLKFETLRWVLNGIGSSNSESIVYLVYEDELICYVFLGSIIGMLNSLWMALDNEASKLLF